jgi:NAD(P)-dependent dehydrogenase (short-subunit alcohol dehydrogenase family)
LLLNVVSIPHGTDTRTAGALRKELMAKSEDLLKKSREHLKTDNITVETKSVETEQSVVMTEGIFKDPHYLEYISKQTPLGRTGKSDDLNGAVVILASSASDYVTGQTIFVDGGWTAW